MAGSRGTAGRPKRRGLVREGGATRPLRDIADLLDDQLTEAAPVDPDLQMERSVVHDLQSDPSGEAGVNGRRGDVDGKAESGLLAAPFHAPGQLAVEREADVLQSADQH